MSQHFDVLGPNAANYVALTPLSFMARAAQTFGPAEATVYGPHRRTWSEVAARCGAFASRLVAHGIAPGDTVSVLAPNIPQMFELHHSVPMAGAVLNAINTRLEPETVAYILDHSGAKLLIADTAYADLVRAAFALMGRSLPVIDICDDQAGGAAGFGQADYEDEIMAGAPDFRPIWPADEWAPLALNYTSGTSGRPKGVVYHHRGAYLMSMGTLVSWNVPVGATYLSVVPMFHCNGWNHPWAMALIGARLVFTRDPAPARILKAIADEGVEYFGGAPVILAMLADSPDAPAQPFSPMVNVFTAGAPPPPAVLEKSKRLGFKITQVYGLTETYGHISECIWRDEWQDLTPAEQAEMQAMQGVAMPMVEAVRVFDRESGQEVPHDGVTQGEIAIRGNTVMSGYFKDPKATQEAFSGGWFWSGDAAVVHENGYIQIRDRLKDVIISGGENISSVEIEAVLHRHPAVQAAAVVARPDPRWGEVPCAFVELRMGHSPSPDEIMVFCRGQLAGFKSPKLVIFCELPKTSTGKIQKFVLREQARQL